MRLPTTHPFLPIQRVGILISIGREIGQAGTIAPDESLKTESGILRKFKRCDRTAP
ncbi:MAG: hypothetical protein KME16_28150 [Scytolyngbya sp. HA4215-MV1]|nr:hypothetical protein [Scytolyngbya sp. HA4215-MV1]